MQVLWDDRCLPSQTWWCEPFEKKNILFISGFLMVTLFELTWILIINLWAVQLHGTFAIFESILAVWLANVASPVSPDDKVKNDEIEICRDFVPIRDIFQNHLKLHKNTRNFDCRQARFFAAAALTNTVGKADDDGNFTFPAPCRLNEPEPPAATDRFFLCSRRDRFILRRSRVEWFSVMMRANPKSATTTVRVCGSHRGRRLAFRPNLAHSEISRHWQGKAEWQGQYAWGRVVRSA